MKFVSKSRPTLPIISLLKRFHSIVSSACCLRICRHQVSLPALSIKQVIDRLAQENINVAGGTLKEGRIEYLVRTLNEFRDVAAALNTMAGTVQRQSAHMRAARALDSAVLESSNLSCAAGALIDGLEVMVACREIGVLVFDPARRDRALVYHCESGDRPLTVSNVNASPSHLHWLPAGGSGWLPEPRAAHDHFPGSGIGKGVEPVFAAAMRAQDRVLGVVALTVDPRIDLPEAELDTVRDLTTRAAVVFEELRLRRALEESQGRERELAVT